MNFTHDMNDGHTLFVFGSNEAGLHGGGAAREAHIYWGAHLRVFFIQTYGLPLPGNPHWVIWK